VRLQKALLVGALALQLWGFSSAKAEEDEKPAEEVKEDKVVDGFSESDRAKMAEGSEKHEFQAEVNRLMDIIINSLYTDKQVFLRELISNAADALEKARFHSVQDETFLGDNKDFEVKIEHDPEAKTISITDTGVGMSKADLINNLGTVAKSGTTNFLEAMAEGSDTNLIGQFGVGFYSAFLVADKVSVTSKCNEDPVQHVWESSADASFTVVDDPRGNTLGRGSRVTLHLKEDAHDYLSEDKLKDSIKKYSQFIQFPIYVKVKKEVEADAEEEEDDDKEDDDDEKKDDVETKDDDKEEEEEKKAPKKKTVFEWEQVNTQKAIWLRAKEDVTEEEYVEFYKSISKDYLDPLAYTHFNAEGEIEFKSILFIPKKAPFDMMDNYHTKKSEVKLFVRRVLVAEKFEELLPRYLNFVRGVVDSDDLPLNVSREQLQQNKIMKVISKKLVRKVLELMKKLAKDEESGDDDEEEDAEKKDDDEEEKKEEKKDKKDEEGQFMKFWKEFNKNLKMGCYEDDSNRSKLSKLLRFHSTKSEEKEISLDKYLDRMQESQESIYYMSGDSIEVMKKAPALQVFKKKDMEVLMLSDHLDEPCLQKLADYEGKKFVSIQKADVKLDESEAEKKKFTKLKDMYKPLTDWWKETLTALTEKGAMKDAGVKVEKVELSKRLTDSPVVVVTSQFGYSAQQEKVMKAQAFQNKDQLSMMSGRKTLEVNPNHPVIVDMLSKIKADKEDKSAIDTAQVLFQTALIESGYEIADPSALVNRVYRLMSKELGVNPDAPLQEVEVPEEEEEAEEDDKEGDKEDDKEEGDDDEKEESKTEL
jgi:heat shock protein beta